MIVVGTGLPRTGTTTLRAALNILGVPKEDVKVGDHMMFPYNRFKEIDKTEPDAKFILTVRESPEKWLASVISRTKVIGGNEQILRNRERMYGSRTVVPEVYLPVYWRRQVSVLDYFQDKYPDTHRDKLLTVCWECGDGWPELCSFLGIDDIPDVPFPHKNKSK